MHAQVDTKIKEKQQELQRVSQAITDLQTRKTQTAYVTDVTLAALPQRVADAFPVGNRQTEAELNEKLLDTYNKLQQAGAERMESDRDAKFRETLASLKKTFPGARTRVSALGAALGSTLTIPAFARRRQGSRD